MYLGGDLVLETVDAILKGSVKPVPQESLIRQETELRPAPKIFKETCRIAVSYTHLLPVSIKG